MITPTVIIVGADKGGVGKTTVARALLDYFEVAGTSYRAFDTESPIGVLKRFRPATTEVVDLTQSNDQMKVFDNLGTAVTVIDVRAGLLSPTLQMLRDIGFLDSKNVKVIVLHVLGASLASQDEIKPITAAIAGSTYISVVNRINDTTFTVAGAIDIPKLDERATEAVDSAGCSFADYTTSEASFVLRGYVKHWLERVYKQFDAANLNVR
jgi:hypothetical protein